MSSQLITSDFNGADQPVFTRGGSLFGTTVSYAVVEFSGSNWNVQRVEHTYNGASTQTQAIPQPVTDITSAFLHNQMRMNAGTSWDGLDDSGAQIELTADDTITYTLPQSTSNWGTGGQVGVTWIVENIDTDPETRMIVEHQNPLERQPGNTSEGVNNEEDQWSITVNAVRDVSETSIAGASSQSNGGGLAFPRGSVSFTLDNDSTVRAFQSDDGQPQEYTFSVVQLPRS